jgi:hypothetical protein
VRHSASTIFSSQRAGMFAGAILRPEAVAICGEVCLYCALGHVYACAACVGCGGANPVFSASAATAPAP